MRFLIDENVGPAVARWLAANGHDVASVYESARGSDDATVLAKSLHEQRILLTCDKDFGDMVHRRRLPHCGIVLLRLGDERPSTMLAALRKLLDHHGRILENRFVVVTTKQVRIAGNHSPPE